MATLLSKDRIRQWLPPIPDDAHKGSFGHLFVVAGSRGFTGAARLCCEAACRSGAGLVTLGIPRSLADIAAVTLLEAMSLPLPDTEKESFSSAAFAPAMDFASDKSAVVLGPGISQHPDTVAFAQAFFVSFPTPLLLDADGLNALSQDTKLLQQRNTKTNAATVLTPHPGEMARLLQSDTQRVQRDRERVARDFAARHHVVVVLKGAGTIIAAPEGECALNPTGNPGLASGGTGDVLSGIIGGLLAQGIPAYEAACIGVYLHGLAADLAIRDKSPRSLIARDLIAALPEAWWVVENESE